MKALYLLLCLSLGLSSITFAQNYSTIASNRIIQKHHLPERISKIAQIDPVRLQVLWNYFTTSFTFSSSETGISVEELLNIQHFDITEYEHLRQDNQQVQFVYRGSIQITLKSGSELSSLLQGYNLNSLINELPERPFPVWTSNNFTNSDFEGYKAQVWDWARDYPSAYLQLTSDTGRMHIHFDDWKNLEDVRRTQILNELTYLIID
nr:hypothetical protein [uncultured Fluviicola sp.]